jgi:hypothetical protein
MIHEGSIFNYRDDLLNTSKFIFYELIPFFLQFYEKKRYSVIAKLTLYDRVQFIV